MDNDDFKVNFLIVGAQRSGTTALFYLVNHHPQVCMHKTKEVDFFNNDYWFEKESVDYTQYHSLFSHRKPQQIIGEASPNYLLHPLAAKRIKQYHSEIKLIFLLRNPIDRAYSAHTRWTQGGIEKRPFEQALLDEIKGIDNTHCYLKRGEYAKQIVKFLDYFPEKQLFIRKTNSFMKDNLVFISRLFEFLGIDSISYMNNPYKKFIEKNYPSMQQNTRELLLDYYQLEIENLETLLNWDLSDWKK